MRITGRQWLQLIAMVPIRVSPVVGILSWALVYLRSVSFSRTAPLFLMLGDLRRRCYGTQQLTIPETKEGE